MPLRCFAEGPAAGLAMRTDKLAVHYQAALTLAGDLLWTKP